MSIPKLRSDRIHTTETLFQAVRWLHKTDDLKTRRHIIVIEHSIGEWGVHYAIKDPVAYINTIYKNPQQKYAPKIALWVGDTDPDGVMSFKENIDFTLPNLYEE